MSLSIVPVTFRQACAFVAELHRHNKPPRGHKFSIGAVDADDKLVGVAMAGRPIARHFDDGRTLEINRTCTDGTKNANSLLYGAIWRSAKAMGYTRCITYTQVDETGASLRAVGWTRVKELPARKSWADSSTGDAAAMRDKVGNGGVERVLWDIKTSGQKSVLEKPEVREPDPFDTEQSREYLIQFMMQHFTDKTYQSYIRGEGGRNALAGDFAWQMARALRRMTGRDLILTP